MSGTLLIIGKVWPEPGSSAAGRHMLELIRLLQQQDWQIHFATPAADSHYRIDLAALGIPEHSIEVNSSRFDDWLKSLQPQLVLFDRFVMEEQFGWRVAQVCPEAIRILDTEDIHALRHARQQALKQERAVSDADLSSDIAKREIASILRCDLSLIISEYEMQLLQQHYRVAADLLCYLPFLCEPISQQQMAQWPGFGQRKDFLFVGTLVHGPNLDAVRYLQRDIWPRIRQLLPDACLHVVGAYAGNDVLQMQNEQQGFLVHGRVEDLQPFLHGCRVCLAPLRFGAGLKGKLLEAMANGLPNVSTSIGAEAIAGDLDWPGLIAQRPQDFAEAAVHLYADEMLWTQAQQRGRAVINQRFAKKAHIDVFMQRLDGLQQHLPQQRQANFTGQMLQYHTTRSTEYMARWIECKNRFKAIENAETGNNEKNGQA
jgi:glycosyltransferase involved in cell wall biosynthesis